MVEGHSCCLKLYYHSNRPRIRVYLHIVFRCFMSAEFRTISLIIVHRSTCIIVVGTELNSEHIKHLGKFPRKIGQFLKLPLIARLLQTI